MTGLLKRLGRGLGAGLTSYGQSMLDQQRQDRLEKLQRDKMDFQSTEGEKDRALKASEGDKNRQNQLDLEAMRAKRMGTGGSRGSSTATKYNNVSWDEELNEDGKAVRTGSFTGQDADGRWIRYDAESDKFSELGKKEKPEAKPDPAAAETFSAKVRKFGDDWANNQAGFFSTDSSDFSKLPEQYRSEDKVGSLINEAMMDVYDKYGPEAAERIFQSWSRITDPNRLFDKLNAWLREQNQSIIYQFK